MLWELRLCHFEIIINASRGWGLFVGGGSNRRAEVDMTTSFCKQTAATTICAVCRSEKWKRGEGQRGRGLWRVTVIETMRGKTRVIKTIKSGSDKLKQRQQLPQCPAARTTTKCSVKF